MTTLLYLYTEMHHKKANTKIVLAVPLNECLNSSKQLVALKFLLWFEFL